MEVSPLGMRVGQPLTVSQLRFIGPPLLIASCKSGGGDTPGGMFRLICCPLLGKVRFSRKFGVSVVLIGLWGAPFEKKTFLFSFGLGEGSS